MKLIVLFMVVALSSYGIGIFIGRLYGYEEVMKKRKELGLDEEDDEWDKNYKR